MSNATDTPIDLGPLWELIDGAPLVDLYPQAARRGMRDDQWNVMANIDIEPDL
jgi:hypothetical protein